MLFWCLIKTDGWKIGDKLFYTMDRLWQGAISDEDSHNLSDSIRNYSFLIVQLITNQEYDYMVLPVSSIAVGQKFIKTVMANATKEVTLPFAYQATCIFQFPSNTTVKNEFYFNNVNFKLKICNIWGIK